MRWKGRGALLGLALGIAVFQVVGSFGAASNQPERKDIGALALVFVLLGPAALAVSDRHPRLAVATAIGATTVFVGLGYPYGPIFVSVAVSMFLAVQHGELRATIGLAVAGYVAFMGAYAVDPRADDGASWLHWSLVAGWVIVVLTVSELVRIRRQQVAERVQAERDERERLVGEQRLGLAQELHDVLAHNISLINVQSSVALHLLDEQPDRARPALTAIKDASHEALQELRTALDVLRHGDDGAPRSPAPRLTELPGLVGGVRASGLDVLLDGDGTLPPLPAAVELAAYRIVQEALTNVTRHAQARSVTVRLGYDDGVTIEVLDDGVGGPALAGNGIRGMQERAAALGGRVEAGPRPGGGFRGRGPPAGWPVVISVLLADDQALVRGGFRALLDAQDDITVVAEASDGEEAVRLAATHRPDVVLMDIRMPGVDGLEATRRIVGDERLGATKVVILTTFDLDEYVFEAIRAGANGFLVKDTEPDELLRAVHAVLAGDALLSPRITRRLIEEFAARAKDPVDVPELGSLTDREREVVALVGEGLTNDEIAERLIMSTATAKTHVSRAMVKLGARDRAQLVVFAYESGLVRPGWAT